MAEPKIRRPSMRGKKMRGAKTGTRAIIRAKRRAEALDYRIMGFTFQQIGEAMKMTAQSAHELVLSALHDTVREPAQELVELELNRLDAMLPCHMEKAITGDAQATAAVMKIMERRAQMLGLDQAKKISAVTTATVQQVNLNSEEFKEIAREIAKSF